MSGYFIVMVINDKKFLPTRKQVEKIIQILYEHNFVKVSLNNEQYQDNHFIKILQREIKKENWKKGFFIELPINIERVLALIEERFDFFDYYYLREKHGSITSVMMITETELDGIMGMGQKWNSRFQIASVFLGNPKLDYDSIKELAIAFEGQYHDMLTDLQQAIQREITIVIDWAS